MKRAWYLPDKYLETREDQSNSNLSTWLITFMVQWWRDMAWWWHDQLVPMELVLLWYKMWCRVSLVIQSLLISTTQQPFNNHPLLYPNMPMINSHTFQSASGVNTITRMTPRRSGGDYPSGQQVVVTNLVSIDWRLICYNLDPWYGLHRPSPIPGVQDLGNERLSLGASPL